MLRAQTRPDSTWKRGAGVFFVLALLLGQAVACIRIPEEEEFSEEVSVDPSVDRISPWRGGLAGGTIVMIETSDFSVPFDAALPGVTFGGLPAFVVGSPSMDSLDVQAPAALQAGPVDVRVTSLDGSEQATLPSGFHYTTAPVLRSVNPSSGDVAYFPYFLAELDHLWNLRR